MNLPSRSLLAVFAVTAIVPPWQAVGSSVSQTYEIAFASFGPNNAEIFVADGNGENPKPFLPHSGFDGNASFSRDGNWIVFTSERYGSFDVYRARRDGSSLERLVSDPAYDDQAALSPDGRQLAFVSSRTGDADVWILDLEKGSLRNLTHHPAGDFRPAWSPDGKWIAFSTDRDSSKPIGRGGFSRWHSTELYVASADGSALRRVTYANKVVGSPSWAPDGHSLVCYEAEIEDVGKIVSVMPDRGSTQIVTFDLATGTRHALTEGPGEKLSPRWVAADRVGYQRGGPDGGLELLAAGQRNAAARGSFCCPDWAPEGGSVVYHRDVEPEWAPPFQRWWSKDEQFRLLRTGVFPTYDPLGERLICSDQLGAINSRDLLAFRRDGTGRTVIFSGTEAKSAIAAAYSPDGQQVAFAYGRFFQSLLGPAVADIAVIDRHGDNLKVLTSGNGNVGFPSWSPDGTQIVYRATSPEKRGLFILYLATGDTRPLTRESSHDNFPAWSPKGDRIAFTGYREGEYDIYTVRPDGTDAQRLTYLPGNDAHCAWSPDGEWIAFTSGRQGFKDEAALHPRNGQPYGEITVMRADGTDVRVLTDNPFEEGTVAWAPLNARRHH